MQGRFGTWAGPQPGVCRDGGHFKTQLCSRGALPRLAVGTAQGLAVPGDASSAQVQGKHIPAPRASPEMPPSMLRASKQGLQHPGKKGESVPTGGKQISKGTVPVHCCWSSPARCEPTASAEPCTNPDPCRPGAFLPLAAPTAFPASSQEGGDHPQHLRRRIWVSPPNPDLRGCNLWCPLDSGGSH